MNFERVTFHGKALSESEDVLAAVQATAHGTDLSSLERARMLADTSTTRLSIEEVLLFLPRDLAHLAGQFFVNFSPVTDSVNSDDPRFTVQLVNNSKSSDFVFP
jgi:hypothetical protein